MSLKFFQFVIVNGKTRESVCFTGQGHGIEDAWKDGVANVNSPFRPSSSGHKANKPVKLAVTLPGGEHVNRHKEDFEGDSPFNPETEK